MGLVLLAVDSIHDVQSLNTDAQYSGFHKGPVSPSLPMVNDGSWPVAAWPVAEKRKTSTLVGHGRRPQKIHELLGSAVSCANRSGASMCNMY